MASAPFDKSFWGKVSEGDEDRTPFFVRSVTSARNGVSFWRSLSKVYTGKEDDYVTVLNGVQDHYLRVWASKGHPLQQQYRQYDKRYAQKQAEELGPSPDAKRPDSTGNQTTDRVRPPFFALISCPDLELGATALYTVVSNALRIRLEVWKGWDERNSRPKEKIFSGGPVRYPKCSLVYEEGGIWTGPSYHAMFPDESGRELVLYLQRRRGDIEADQQTLSDDESETAEELDTSDLLYDDGGHWPELPEDDIWSNPSKEKAPADPSRERRRSDKTPMDLDGPSAGGSGQERQWSGPTPMDLDSPSAGGPSQERGRAEKTSASLDSSNGFDRSPERGESKKGTPNLDKPKEGRSGETVESSGAGSPSREPGASEENEHDIMIKQLCWEWKIPQPSDKLPLELLGSTPGRSDWALPTATDPVCYNEYKAPDDRAELRKTTKDDPRAHFRVYTVSVTKPNQIPAALELIREALRRAPGQRLPNNHNSVHGLDKDTPQSYKRKVRMLPYVTVDGEFAKRYRKGLQSTSYLEDGDYEEFLSCLTVAVDRHLVVSFYILNMLEHAGPDTVPNLEVLLRTFIFDRNLIKIWFNFQQDIVVLDSTIWHMYRGSFDESTQRTQLICTKNLYENWTAPLLPNHFKAVKQSWKLPDPGGHFGSVRPDDLRFSTDYDNCPLHDRADHTELIECPCRYGNIDICSLLNYISRHRNIPENVPKASWTRIRYRYNYNCFLQDWLGGPPTLWELSQTLNLDKYNRYIQSEHIYSILKYLKDAPNRHPGGKDNFYEHLAPGMETQDDLMGYNIGDVVGVALALRFVLTTTSKEDLFRRLLWYQQNELDRKEHSGGRGHDDIWGAVPRPQDQEQSREEDEDDDTWGAIPRPQDQEQSRDEDEVMIEAQDDWPPPFDVKKYRPKPKMSRSIPYLSETSYNGFCSHVRDYQRFKFVGCERETMWQETALWHHTKRALSTANIGMGSPKPMLRPCETDFYPMAPTACLSYFEHTERVNIQRIVSSLLLPPGHEPIVGEPYLAPSKFNVGRIIAGRKFVTQWLFDPCEFPLPSILLEGEPEGLVASVLPPVIRAGTSYLEDLVTLWDADTYKMAHPRGFGAGPEISGIPQHWRIIPGYELGWNQHGILKLFLRVVARRCMDTQPGKIMSSKRRSPSGFFDWPPDVFKLSDTPDPPHSPNVSRAESREEFRKWKIKAKKQLTQRRLEEKERDLSEGYALDFNPNDFFDPEGREYEHRMRVLSPRQKADHSHRSKYLSDNRWKRSILEMAEDKVATTTPRDVQN